MKLLIVLHSNKEYDPKGINGAWEFLPHYFKTLGHTVRIVKKKQWLWYPFIVHRFKPDAIISVGRVSGLLTGFHRRLSGLFSLFSSPHFFVHDLTDHPHFYRSEKRIEFVVRNHDLVVTPSRFNFEKYHCDAFLPNGSDFTPPTFKSPKKTVKQQWDAGYVGQIHSFYHIDKLVSDCRDAGISLKVIHGTPTKEAEHQLADVTACVLPISWDSSTKMCDYAAMGKPTVTVKPNLAEKIDFPALYCTNLVAGIKTLLRDKKRSARLGKEARKWFLQFSGTWKEQAKKYIEIIRSHKQIFTMDLEKDITAGVLFSRDLATHGLVGEFYVTGEMIEKYPKEMKKIAKSHIVGGHGYHHEDFSRLSYGEADDVIKRTIAIAKKHGITLQGWRFPGFGFTMKQLRLVAKHGLYDSSIRDRVIKRWGRFYGLWHVLSRLKRGVLDFPYLVPCNLREKPWSVVDLNDVNSFTSSGRVVFHCHSYESFRDTFVAYLKKKN